MAVTSTDLKEYLHLPPDSSENLTIYIDAAISKARAAGVPQYERNAMYDIFIIELAAMYYENRGLKFSGSYQATAEENARRMINSFVLELRYAGEDPETPTDNSGEDPETPTDNSGEDPETPTDNSGEDPETPTDNSGGAEDNE